MVDEEIFDLSDEDVIDAFELEDEEDDGLSAEDSYDDE